MAPGITQAVGKERTSESGKVRLAARKGRIQDFHSQCLPWMTAGTVVPLAGEQNTEG